MTHLIKHLSFGKDYPGIINPLDGSNVAAAQGMLHLFWIRVFIPCILINITLWTWQHALNLEVKSCQIITNSITKIS